MSAAARRTISSQDKEARIKQDHNLSFYPGRPSAWIMITTGAMATIVALVFARLAYGLILPFMREGLDLTYQQAGSLGTATALGYLCLIMVSGIVAARWGGRKTIVIGMLMACAGFTGLSVSSHYAWLLVWMTLLGFGTAFSYTPTISLLVGWFPQNRATVIGAVNSGAGIGMVLAGMLVPYLNTAFVDIGWRVTWGVFAVAGLLTICTVLLFLPDAPVPLYDSKAKQGRSSGSIYLNGYVIKIGILYAIVGSTYVVQAIFMYSFALKAGLSAVQAGGLASLAGILSIFSGPVGGWLTDRYGRRQVIQALIAADLTATVIPVVWQSFPGFALHYFIIGASMSALFSVILVSATEAVPKQDAPIAVSYVTLFYAIAQFICPAVAGILIEKTGGFAVVFMGSSVLIGTSLLLSLTILHPSKDLGLPELNVGAK